MHLSGKSKTILSVALCVLFLFSFCTVALAHSGRTDASGGHHDYNNVSGLGGYHYHHGYGPHLHPNGACPYSSPAPAPAPTPAPAPRKASVTKVTLNKTRLTLRKGRTYQLKAAVHPANAANKAVTWKSSQPKKVKVSAKGKIRALQRGRSAISVTTKSGRKTARCIVTVV